MGVTQSSRDAGRPGEARGFEQSGEGRDAVSPRRGEIWPEPCSGTTSAQEKMAPDLRICGGWCPEGPPAGRGLAPARACPRSVTALRWVSGAFNRDGDAAQRHAARCPARSNRGLNPGLLRLRACLPSWWPGTRRRRSAAAPTGRQRPHATRCSARITRQFSRKVAAWESVTMTRAAPTVLIWMPAPRLPTIAVFSVPAPRRGRRRRRARSGRRPARSWRSPRRPRSRSVAGVSRGGQLADGGQHGPGGGHVGVGCRHVHQLIVQAQRQSPP